MLEWTELAKGFSDTNTRDLTEFIARQRWFGSKNRGIAGIELVDQIILQEEPRLVIALVEVRVEGGTSDVYQLILKSSTNRDDSGDGSPITIADKVTIYEASSDSRIAELMASASQEGTVLSGQLGEVRFRTIRDLHSIATVGYSTRPLGADQSNTSVVVNERLLLKLYRRLEAGTNPELELLLFLTEHDFEHVPQLAGWYSYAGSNLRTILGLAQQFVPVAVDGWSLGIKELPQFPDQFLARLERLGEVVGELHCVFASDIDDPSFAPEHPTEETAAILGAKLEDQIDGLSDAIPDGRSDELRSLAHTLTQEPIAGQLIRTHGDLHLGQVLWTGDDWLVIDFEGEPTRSLSERRQKFHPLRDIAGLLRSFSYLVAALGFEHGKVIPTSWVEEASKMLLTSYRLKVASAGILPNDLQAQERLLQIFTLEKILYELDYEIQNRPDWLHVPLAGIDRLLSDRAE